MNRLPRALLAVPAAVVLVATATTTVASASSPSGPPPTGDNVWCVSVTGAKACFAAYGDRMWVKDTKANGQSAGATIKEDALNSTWYRECFNNLGADGGWAYCDWDVPEQSDGVLWVAKNPFIGAQAYVKINTSGYI